MAIPTPIDDRLKALAHVPVLLVATDYDGTLAPIVEDPTQAKPDREAIVALRSLAKMPNTAALVVSGRSLADLAELTGAPDNVMLVGSHGSEYDVDFSNTLTPEQKALHDKIRAEFEKIADGKPGFGIEIKPASVAFHYRNADEEAAAEALKQAEAGLASLEGVFVKHGKKVLELTVVPTNKGTALNMMRQREGASAVIFFGDDKTDEDGFATLSGPDVAIKVGDGESIAPYRLETTTDVARALARLSELRAAWLAGSHAHPITEHAVLSDQRTVALVAPGADVVWLCTPRIDSPALFAGILGGPAAGHFSITPKGAKVEDAKAAYVDDSFHLRTTWPNGVTVTDYLDCSGGRVMQRAGRADLVRVIEGEGRIEVKFAPRLDFGRVPTRLEVRTEGLLVEDTFDPIVLRAPGVSWRLEDEGPHQTAVTEIVLRKDHPVIMELRYGTGSLSPTVLTEEQRSEQTRRFWGSWAEQLRLPHIEPDLVRRSALVLKALCHGPTGAIAAAGTTSLPESLGGVRNWDYRYCWPRDASMAAASLVRLGSTGEAMHLLDWLLGIVDDLASPDRLSPIYTVAGTELGSEAEIPELSGYAGSRPVRVGNLASRQLQLDVFGPIVELVHLLMVRGAPLSAEHWRLVQSMVTAVISRWREPDHGIWELRGPRRHHVHSKVMCWQTVDLGCLIAERLVGRAVPEWASERDAIAGDLLEKGWSAEVNSFTTAYGEPDVDAAVLTVGLKGLLSVDDPRFSATIEAVERELLDDGTVYRYKLDDNLPGTEGGFHICTAWLIEALAMTGRIDDAKKLFERYVACVGSTGLLSEEVEPGSGTPLGNHPQAYSHLGLIDAALSLARAQE